MWRDKFINFLEKIGILPKLSSRDLMIRQNLKELNDNGVKVVVTEKGGWRIEFDDDEARKWYYNESFKKFKGEK